MTEPNSASADVLFEEFRRQYENLADVKARFDAVRGTAMSPRRELRVSVGSGGVITEMKFEQWLSQAHGE